MRWVYLSPHLDDAVFSCGGLIWEQTRQGLAVEIWTFFSADPPPGPLSPFAQSLHHRWGLTEAGVDQRREEDRRACARLSAAWLHLPYPDCIYRKAGCSSGEGGEGGIYLYPSQEAIFGHPRPSEGALADALQTEIMTRLREDDILVSPLTLGGHVDHQLVRQAAEGCGCVAWYYADFPYATAEQKRLSELTASGWEAQIFRISPAGLNAWGEAIATYASQISSFWRDAVQMKASLTEYCEAQGGVVLWKSP